MGKLTAVLERITQTKQRLDEEADRLAVRLDRLERDAPVIIQQAHRILNDQLRELDATAQLIERWANALDVADSLHGYRSPSPSREPAAPPYQYQAPTYGEPPEDEFVRGVVEEPPKDPARIERALQTMANEMFPSQQAVPRPPARLQPSIDAAPHNQGVLDEQQKEQVIESVLQALAKKLHVPHLTGVSQVTRTRLKQSNDDMPPSADAPRAGDELQSGEDAAKADKPRIGTIRAA
jgi:hypothetical protein